MILYSKNEELFFTETRWLYTNSMDFPKLREASNRTCVIPMGCVEKHSVYLPLGTDIINGNFIAHLASKLETVCVFPDFTFGDVPCGPHAKRPEGTICLDVRMQMLLLEQLCDEIAANGFNKILVANNHGGNYPWLQTFARNWGVKPHKAVFAYTGVPHTVPHEMAEILLEKGTGTIPELTPEDEALILKYHEEGMRTGHACINEAALTMAHTPKSVHLDRLGTESGARRNIPELQKLIDANVKLSMDGWLYFYPDWFTGGDPYGLNERIAKAAARISSERLADIYKAFKEDTYLLEQQKKAYFDKSFCE